MSLPFEKFLIDPSRVDCPKTISLRGARSDIDFLIEALLKAYPAKWTMTTAQWDGVIQQLKNIHFDPAVEVTAFGDSLADILWSIPDGHIKVRCGKMTCGQIITNNFKKPSTGNNLAEFDKGEYWTLQTKSTPKGDLAILAISGFPQSADPSWNGFSQCIDEILRSQNLVVDLRGNEGGDDSKAIELASALLGYEMSESWIRQIFCETAEAYALQINTYEKINWNIYRSKSESPPAALINHLVNLKNKAIELSNNPISGGKLVVEVPNEENHKNEKLKFTGNIFLLVDPRTASSGEWTCLYFKKHPNTKIVGENTHGMIHFGNTGYLQLPHSGLSVALCMKINELTDGSFYEKTGIPPDIEITGRDSLEFVLSELFQ